MSNLRKISWKKAPFLIKLMMAVFAVGCLGLVVGGTTGVLEFVNYILKGCAAIKS